MTAEVSMVTQIASAIGIGVASGGFSKLAMVAIRSDWPDAYVYDRTLLEKTSSATMSRYVALRTLPLFICCYLGAATVLNQGFPALPFGVSAWLTFAVLTSISAIFRSFAEKNLRRRRDLVVGLGRMLGTALLVLLATVVGQVLPEAAPQPRELLVALWTAAFVAILAVATRHLMSSDRASTAQKIALARRDMGEDNWGSLSAVAQEFEIEPAILESIVVCEVLQRPRWLRSIERLVGKLHKPGTYGVAQSYADHPIADRESIEMLGQQIKDLGPIYGLDPWLRFESYRSFIERRGATDGYTSEVESTYAELFDELAVPGVREDPLDQVITTDDASPRLRVFMHLVRSFAYKLRFSTRAE